MTRLTKNKLKTLERKLTAPFELKSFAPEVKEKDGMTWHEFPVTLKARDADPILHWAWGKVTHDFTGMQTPSAGSIPIDHVHGDNALGYIDEFDTSDGLMLKGKLVSTEKGDLAWQIATQIKAGIPYQSSIFFGDLEDGNEMEIQDVREKHSDTVNGQKFEGPGYIVRKWLLRGVAVCLYGADPKTSTQVLKHQPNSEEPMSEREKLKEFTAKFGAVLANEYVIEGLNLEEATSKFNGVLQERLKEAEKFASERDAKITALEAEVTALKDKKAEQKDDDDEDDEDEEDDDKNKKEQSSKETEIAELKAKLSVWEQQYGGTPYNKFADVSPGTTGKPRDPNAEYVAECVKAVLKAEEE